MKKLSLIAVALAFAATTLFVGGEGILRVDNAGYSKTSNQIACPCQKKKKEKDGEVACRCKKKKDKDYQLVEIA